MCTRSFYRMLTGIIERNTSEYINLAAREINIETERKRLVMMQKLPSYTSCAYCIGLTEDTPKYPAAEQLHKEENRWRKK